MAVNQEDILQYQLNKESSQAMAARREDMLQYLLTNKEVLDGTSLFYTQKHLEGAFYVKKLVERGY